LAVSNENIWQAGQKGAVVISIEKKLVDMIIYQHKFYFVKAAKDWIRML
jgi:hypothetical protein